MNIGYACLLQNDKNAKFKTLRLKNLNYDNLYKVINNNLNVLDYIIDYNIKNNIKLFRITSDLIPFNSTITKIIDWQNLFKNKFNLIGNKIKNNNIRVSFHTNHYTVLNSDKSKVVKNSIIELNHLNDLLSLLNTNTDCKIILHIGGIYNNKKDAINRFIINQQYLNNKVLNRIAIENDDKNYNINDLLEIYNKTNLPIIYDNLHNFVNSYNKRDDNYWINLCNKTWKQKDGKQKIHYSQQNLLSNKKNAHSLNIDTNIFLEFYNSLSNKNIDVMLEVKNTNISAINCINLIDNINK